MAFAIWRQEARFLSISSIWFLSCLVRRMYALPVSPFFLLAIRTSLCSRAPYRARRRRRFSYLSLRVSLSFRTVSLNLQI